MSTTEPRSAHSAKTSVPRGLATATDLNATDVSAIADAVNPLIADAFTLYVKTKNFHWHLSGPRFRDYHLLFDEQAGSILDSIDVLAERLRKIGATTLRSIDHIHRLQRIPDDNEDYVPADEMIRRLLNDNRPSRHQCYPAVRAPDGARPRVCRRILSRAGERGAWPQRVRAGMSRADVGVQPSQPAWVVQFPLSD